MHKQFDGEAGLLPALNLADAFALMIPGGDGRRARVRRETSRLGCPRELKAHIRRSSDASKSVGNRPVEPTPTGHA